MCRIAANQGRGEVFTERIPKEQALPGWQEYGYLCHSTPTAHESGSYATGAALDLANSPSNAYFSACIQAIVFSLRAPDGARPQ